MTHTHENPALCEECPLALEDMATEAAAWLEANPLPSWLEGYESERWEV